MGIDPPALFVYGTLMPGQLRWPVLEPFALGWDRGSARGQLWDTGLGYPAARFDPAGDDIPGVVVTVDPDRLADVIVMLDRIEGVGILFRRVEVQTSARPALSYEWLGSTDGMRRLLQGWSGKGVIGEETAD